MVNEKISKKSPTMPKKLNLGFFNIHSVAKHQQMKGEPLGKNVSKKSVTVPKKLKGGPFSLSRYGRLRGKRGKTFLVQFVRPNESIWDHKIV